MPSQRFADNNSGNIAAGDSAVGPQYEELKTLIERLTRQDGIHLTAIDPLCLYRSSIPTAAIHGVYEPSLCVIAQGRKIVMLAEESYIYAPAQYLLASVDLHIVGQVIEATPQAPYLSLKIDLDPAEISALVMESGMSAASASAPATRGISVNRIDPGLLDAVIRLLRLLEIPCDIPVLKPLIMREILYRLLMGEQSTHLRRIASGNSETQRVAQAIRWLKQHYADPIRIEDVARVACMSPSGLFHHFKAVTAMSPLQYQKQLRLQEARRLMLGEALDATTAGYRVGYESPSQFSREYSRLFGAPPRRDIAQLRVASTSSMVAV
ncbi:MAG: AraC family transcriptional regulator [Fibrella sp.]|nr:AraC family transcriptional regulator [Armatimonadota bacterium]